MRFPAPVRFSAPLLEHWHRFQHTMKPYYSPCVIFVRSSTVQFQNQDPRAVYTLATTIPRIRGSPTSDMPNYPGKRFVRKCVQVCRGLVDDIKGRVEAYERRQDAHRAGETLGQFLRLGGHKCSWGLERQYPRAYMSNYTLKCSSHGSSSKVEIFGRNLSHLLLGIPELRFQF